MTTVRIDELHPHPKNEAIYGREDVAELVDLIAKSDWIKPLVVNRATNRIISGHRRWLAARELGLASVPVEYADFADEWAELEALLLENASREKTPEQRVREGEQWREIETERARKRQGQRTDLTSASIDAEVEKAKPIRSAKKVADRVGFGGASTYERARKAVEKADALREAGNQQAAETLLKVLNEQSVDAAHKIATAPEPVQQRALEKIAQQRARASNALKAAETEVKREALAASAQDAETPDARLICGDMRDAMWELDEASIDVIVTDPPYPRDYLDLYKWLSYESARVLKPGGLLIALSGQSYLPEIMAMLSEGLTYHWMIAYLTPGGQSAQVFPRRVNPFWKPALVYVNGTYDGVWFGDVVKSEVNANEKDGHMWQQSVSGMRDLMQRFVRPGMTVLDPFLGSGTTGVIALELGAQFVGIDIDAQSVAISRARLAEVKRAA